jgi:integrase/recombinase XerD
MEGGGGMKIISKGIQEYIQLKKSYGLKYQEGASTLLSFSNYCSKNKYKNITVNIILEWVQTYPNASRNNISKKLMILRGFTSYWKVFNDKTEIPPKDLFRYQKIRINPHIYSGSEVRKILSTSKKLGAEPGQSNPIRPYTFKTIFGLLASSGLRRNEAINLKRKDVDFINGTLMIEMTKFRKSRLIPVHPSTLKKLKAYAKFRDEVIKKTKCDNFFIMNRGQAVDGDSIYYAFVHVCKMAGIRPTLEGTGYPRIHDLRHTFVVRAILGWLRDGQNIHSMMPALSTYIGHAEPADTYWYLTGVPELMRFGLHKEQR